MHLIVVRFGHVVILDRGPPQVNKIEAACSCSSSYMPKPQRLKQEAVMPTYKQCVDRDGNIGHWVTLKDGRKIFIKD